VSFVPVFSKAVDLERVPTDVITQIVHELNEVAHSMDSLPRGGVTWRSLTSTRLRMIVQGRTVEYVIEADHQRIVVLLVSR
jgi:hypothetical protein